MKNFEKNRIFKTIAIIPARGGSKGAPRKNIRPLAGKPLIAYSIEVAKQSKYIDKIFVSTEDKEIAKLAEKYGAEVITRPSELARDDTPDLPVFQHAIRTLKENENYLPEIVVNLRPTCPLRSVNDVDNAIKKILEQDCDSVRSVKEVTQHPYWMFEVKKDDLKNFIKDIDFNKYYQRQLLPNLYIVNGAVDVMKTDIIINKNELYGKNIKCIIMPQERSIDIDTELDLKIAEIIKTKK